MYDGTYDGAAQVLRALESLLPASSAATPTLPASNPAPASTALPGPSQLSPPSPASHTTQHPEHTAMPRQSGTQQMPAVRSAPVGQPDQQGQSCQQSSSATAPTSATLVEDPPPPTSSPTRQPRSYRAAASTPAPAPTATSTAPPPTPTASQQALRRPRSDPTKHWERRRHFRLYTPAGCPGHESWRTVPVFRLMHGGDFPLEDWLRGMLRCPNLDIVDFRKGGTQSRPFIHFEVATLVQADAIVRYRHRLKAVTPVGDKYVICDVLTPEEAETHSKLFPIFLEAIRAGRKAQFNRAFLRVDGIPVTL